MPNTFTTTLPDEDQPVLGNGVEDEIAVDRESAPSNYGDVRVQTREVGETAWDNTAAGWDEQVLSYDTLTTIVTGREDGEEYEVRARTETEHVTGAWTTPVSIITVFPGVTDFAATATGETTADLTWTDKADNEDGYRIIREEREDGVFLSPVTVDTLSPNTAAYTDSSCQPGTTYRYRVETFTEHSSATTDPLTVTTDTSPLPSRRGSSRWRWPGTGG